MVDKFRPPRYAAPVNGAATNRRISGGGAIGCLLALALLFRLIVPAGWMPVTGGGYAITLCTGAGAVSAWVDRDGVVHKDGKAPAQKADHPCVFAGFSTDVAAPGAIAILDGFAGYASLVLVRPSFAVAIGRGLAAPPPPPTGPPLSL